MANRIKMYKKYQIDPDFGFLTKAPLVEPLETPYDTWEIVAKSLPEGLAVNNLKRELESLPILSIEGLKTKAEQERAMLILAVFAHTFVAKCMEGVKQPYLPESIAIPFVQLSEKLGRPPIISHASMVLNNWRYKSEQAQIFEAKHLDTLIKFTNRTDEVWFFMLTAEIEKVGAKGIKLIIDTMEAAKEGSIEVLGEGLSQLTQLIQQLTSILNQMCEGCDPMIFYRELRPFLSSFNNVWYKGVKRNTYRSYHGGSAAQSSLIQLFDAALNNQHKGSAAYFLKEMKQYMPPAHRHFIDYVSQNSLIYKVTENTSDLITTHQNCLTALHDFRTAHLKIAAEYIVKPSKQTESQIVGTGGTSALRFLKEVRGGTSTKKHYYLIHIQYLGFRFHGWAPQPNVKTVKQMMDKTMYFVLGHRNFKTMGSSRTDAMVSANHFLMELFVKEAWEPADLLRLINKNSPQDIQAIKVEEVDEKFNIIQSPKHKEYLYLFAYGARSHPFSAALMATFPEDLDIELMKEGARLFEGSHNFRHYCTKAKPGKQYQRTILKSEIEENTIFTANFFPKKSYAYHIHGKGFLRNQVRLMMGQLVALGKGMSTLQDIKYTLQENDLKPLNYIAPASGLILNKIHL